MNPAIRESLTGVLTTILRDLAFLFADIPQEEVPTPDQVPLHQFQVRFSGHASGSFILVFPHSICLELTANVLGYEAQDPFVTQHSEDGARELLNILSSHMLTALAGEEPTFNLSVPESRPFAASEWKTLAKHEDSIVLTIEGKPILLHAEYRAS